MNPTTTPSTQTPYSAFPHEFQELCSRAMDQAIGMEIASFDAVLVMQSRIMDACGAASYDAAARQHARSLTPAFGDLFGVMAQTISSFMELQLAWLTIMTPYAAPKSDTVLHMVAPVRGDRNGRFANNDVASNAAAGSVRTMPHPQAQGLEHSMDIAIGARAA